MEYYLLNDKALTNYFYCKILIQQILHKKSKYLQIIMTPHLIY